MGRAPWLALWLSISAGVWGGCKFPELPPVDTDAHGGDAGTGPDAAVDAAVDAPIACQPDSVVCDDTQGVYSECSSAGVVSLQIQCPLGCAPSAEKCVDVDPGNGLAMYLDMAATAPDLALSGNTLINTATGTILVNGEGVTVPNVVANGIRVFIVRSLTIEGTVQVTRVYGSWPLAFVSHGNVAIRGLLDVSAHGAEGGAGAYWGAEQSSSRPCSGSWGDNRGAAGAGGGEVGGAGGATSTAAALPGAAAAPSVEPLQGGCEGGTVSSTGTSYGGGGGGGLQITSRTRIDITGAGTIDASGGGAVHTGAAAAYAGGGGGGGGNVLLEAPQVVLDGASVVVSTKGGSGAGAGNLASNSGVDGGTDAPRAPGGTSTTQSPGGLGSDGTLGPGAGFAASCGNCTAGGGGGAAGMTVVRTQAGAIAPQNGAAIRSKNMVAQLRTRLVP